MPVRHPPQRHRRLVLRLGPEASVIRTGSLTTTRKQEQSMFDAFLASGDSSLLQAISVTA